MLRKDKRMSMKMLLKDKYLDIKLLRKDKNICYGKIDNKHIKMLRKD